MGTMPDHTSLVRSDRDGVIESSPFAAFPRTMRTAFHPSRIAAVSSKYSGIHEFPSFTLPEGPDGLKDDARDEPVMVIDFKSPSFI
jgi:hypothetical protein